MNYIPKHEMDYYLKHKWVEKYLPSEYGGYKDIVKRVVYFMDETNLKPSSLENYRYRNKDIPNKLGFDHTQLWFMGRKYLYTTEPYLNKTRNFEENLKRNNIRYRRVNEFGMWNPPQTTLFFIEIPGQLDIDLFADIASNMKKWL